MILLSVLGSAAEDVLRLAGVDNLDGKILLDASDPLDFSSGRPQACSWAPQTPSANGSSACCRSDRAKATVTTLPG